MDPCRNLSSSKAVKITVIKDDGSEQLGGKFQGAVLILCICMGSNMRILTQ